jgi:hypothetical protein
MLGVVPAAVHNALKSGTILDSCVLMPCSALRLLRYLVFVAACIENTDSRCYVDTSGRSFLTAKLEICKEYFYRAAQKLKRGIPLCVFQTRLSSVNMSTNSSYIFVVIPCSRKEEEQRACAATENILS